MKPVPLLVALAMVLSVGPIALAVGHRSPPPAPTGPTLAQIADDAGCRLTEFQDGMHTHPPVTGEFVERALAADGSYAGRRPPNLPDTIHALDRLTREDTDKVLLFENRTGMSAPVAATAYLSVMTCPRVDRRVLHALAAFRERRKAFGQSF
jgi:hypothetical protein